MLLLFFLVLLVLAWLLIGALQRTAAQRALVAFVGRIPASELDMSLPCGYTLFTQESQNSILFKLSDQLVQPQQRATVFCLLGNYHSALVAYTQSAVAGDTWSALQIYFLQARSGDIVSAQQILSKNHFSAKELQNFFNSAIRFKPKIDVLPIAQRMVELYPKDVDSWKLWQQASQQYEYALHWQSALDAYLAAIHVQEQLGIKIGHSSFELASGRIYQTQFEPRDLQKALLYYDRALADMDFLGSDELSFVYLYRGEVYQNLRSVYTTTQVLQEFLHSLELNSKNYWAARAIASTYLYDIKNYSLAEYYINLTIDLNPAPYYAYFIRGDIYRQQGNLKAASTAYTDALARQPGYQPALDRLAAVQAELQKQAP